MAMISLITQRIKKKLMSSIGFNKGLHWLDGGLSSISILNY